ncbi:MAG: response regulator transcription factor [Thermogemmatispora sp.]|jgi:two-component system KDP operon response regulator KdpE|uniref:DNA-binding response regulator n=1 Tax=Thermogemmatispora aurantia TaxID=2045279 RepID=A0A5J4KFX9_9CHLR|nr:MULTISPECIES: response regulator transcription factor [Thermogemmatispora]MBE3566720.1 response regulator transcription factor [Thermogemmatispora sp.]GER85320.1 DNA-binding response regulator [Thermogemmatispora aurantia]
MASFGATILVVEDEPELAGALERSLIAHGYRVQSTGSGEEALALFSRAHPDLVLLDLLLPDVSGLEVCRRIRAVSPTPIIVLSVKNSEHDKVEALDLGADDYVAKPFGIAEVLARIRVALRRLERQNGHSAEEQVRIGPLVVDLGSRRVLLNGHDVALTPTEYELLRIFVTHRGKLLTRQMLLQMLWGAASYDRMHSLHVYVAQLRQKIEPRPGEPRLILTIPGVGYRFSDEVEAARELDSSEP